MRKGILQKQYPFPVRRYVQTMSLRDNPELIAAHPINQGENSLIL